MWMLAQNVLARGCGILSQLALAALLRPEDFGLIGITYSITTVIAAVINVGIDDVILQRRQALRLWSEPAFWISLIFGIAASLLVLAISPLAALVYKSPELSGLLAILALSMPIGAMSSVPAMIMRARMQFGVTAVYGTVETLVTALMTVILAWYNFGAYSFVIPAPIMAAVRVVVWWHFAHFKINFRPQPGRWKYVFKNTTAVFLTRSLITVMNQGDYLILGLLASKASVGIYYFGFRLAAQPVWALAGNLSSVLFPALVQLKNQPERQAWAAVQASTLLSFCVMPLAFIQAAVAEPLITSFFGNRWVLSIPIIQLLSIGLALDAISWIAGSFLSARGEFVAGLRYVIVQMPIFFVLVGIGAALDGSFGVACTIFLFYAVTQPIYVHLVYRRVGVTARQVALIYVRPIAYAAFAAGTGLTLSLLPGLAGRPLLRATVIAAAAAAVYAALVRVLSPDVWGELQGRILGVSSRVEVT